MTIYYFGNTIVTDDRMAPRIVHRLKKAFPAIIFRHSDPTGQWWQGEQNPILLDTVVGLDTVKVFTTLDAFEKLDKRITPHDYDLLMDLAFLLKLKKITSFTLIGIPEKGKTDHIINETIKIITEHKKNPIRQPAENSV